MDVVFERSRDHPLQIYYMHDFNWQRLPLRRAIKHLPGRTSRGVARWCVNRISIHKHRVLALGFGDPYFVQVMFPAGSSISFPMLRWLGYFFQRIYFPDILRWQYWLNIGAIDTPVFEGFMKSSELPAALSLFTTETLTPLNVLQVNLVDLIPLPSQHISRNLVHLTIDIYKAHYRNNLFEGASFPALAQLKRRGSSFLPMMIRPFQS
ncbi:hypothetical protein M422DRAFT_257556 [Sphaerobolus stellatus SS14]|uniref:Uncharacterized protein n=1 Tax=Sphaerobolus stellatus (strain SS14) TaxID=990650 RepID=A0A0C9U9H5_SPHS4|nr:hypothetical protein M422DRAFT_257556 [Sphaerobolus stellatus SS14]